MHLVDGMMNQYAKFLKSSLEVPWREPISSLNYLLTSKAWRPETQRVFAPRAGFINNLLTKKGHIYRIYLPPDANSLLVTMQHCLRTTNFINPVVAGKQPMPQWLTYRTKKRRTIAAWAPRSGGGRHADEERIRGKSPNGVPS